jgi:integrase
VVEVNAKFHPTGGRFLVKDYPKDGEYRRLKLTSQIVAKLQAYARERGLSDDDLVFAMPQRGPVLNVLPNPDRLGRTEPNAADRTYRHGTLSAYTAGRCRCEHCKNAFAQYRRQRRVAGVDDPRTPRVRDTDGHIPRDWFRNQVWRPALAAAEVTAVRPHDLRHAHASWLQVSGVASAASFGSSCERRGAGRRGQRRAGGGGVWAGRRAAVVIAGATMRHLIRLC